ncbi:hypothetical protein J7U46_06555 [Pelomonas sp. V22]|uniref:hypothetical protein n=1 Tax=Pelomonas sp. V22 TaxID=2822139 RepID=UPI0024A807DE|nr:hypothetical protein [Pelomonas sp. V22]MDI4632701.1 hypothetical protein [Pelomonas sp. V22]
MKKLVGLGQRALQCLAGLALSATLVACGGGGGSAGTPVVGGGGTTTPTTPATDVATVTMSLSSTTVTAGAPATLTVKVVNKAGTALPGLIVKFSTDGGLGAFSAASALTDASGVASTVMSPAVATSTGADTVKATVTYLDKSYSASTGFQLTATNVTIASFTSDVANLSAYGQANLTVTLVGTSATTPVTLAMTSSCTTSGKGSLTPATQTTSTGRATFTFRDGGCGAVAASENLQVSVTGTSLTQSLALPVSSPSAASIGFVSAAPTSIYLRGSGLVESSNVTFQVKDGNNNGLPGKTVVLEPSVLVGDLRLDDQTGAVTKITDSNGNVIVRINSGTVPTPVRIKATLQGSNISTVSSALAIAVGLPSQLNFSMAPATLNIEGYSIQATPNTFTVIAADRLGNPVPDGTAVNFVAEGGQIQAIKMTALNNSGIATTTANFVSASPVPVDGRVTVVAYALGEKSFLDVNGNNVYDAGEDFQDLGDIFLDRKYDNFYQASEDQFVSLATGDSKSCLPAASSLLATDVTVPVRPNTCSQQWGRAYVRRASQIIFSTSDARPLWGEAWHPNAVGVGGSCAASATLTTHYVSDVKQDKVYKVVSGTQLYAMGGSSSISITLADANGVAFNPMAAGTVASFVATDGLSTTLLGGSPVPSTAYPTALNFSYKFDEKTDEGTVTINLKSPSGLTTSVPVKISTRAIGQAVKDAIKVAWDADTNVPKKVTADPDKPATWSLDQQYRYSLAACTP